MKIVYLQFCIAVDYLEKFEIQELEQGLEPSKHHCNIPICLWSQHGGL